MAHQVSEKIIYIILISPGITSGRVLDGEFYTQAAHR